MSTEILHNQRAIAETKDADQEELLRLSRQWIELSPETNGPLFAHICRFFYGGINEKKASETELIDIRITLNKRVLTIKEIMGRGAEGLVCLVEDADTDLSVVKFSIPYRHGDAVASITGTYDVSGLDANRVILDVGKAQRLFNELSCLDALTKASKQERLTRVPFPRYVGAHFLHTTVTDGIINERFSILAEEIEYLRGETLGQALITEHDDEGMNTRKFRRYTEELLQAINYLHQHGVLHNDLKPHNIMLTDSGLKAFDFGNSRNTKKTTSRWSQTVRRGWTRGYMIRQFDDVTDSPLRDSFAVGRIVQRMKVPQLDSIMTAINTRTPYDAEIAEHEAMNKLVQDALPEFDSETAAILKISLEMTAIKPDDRLSVDEALRRLEEIEGD